MKARQISIACVLCGVLLAVSGCAFRVLEPAGEATPGAAQQETTAGQPETGQPTADQPASSETGTATSEGSAATAEGTGAATAGGEAQDAATEESKAYIPAFGQAGAEAGCRQIVLNGGMEEDTAWRFAGGKPARYATDAARAGTRSILAGLTAGRPYHIYSDARQWVSIPAKAITATLRLWWYPRTEEQTSRLIERCTRGNCPTGSLTEGPLPAAHDLQYVLAVRPDWSFEWLLRAKANAADWRPLEFDLTRYAGRTIAVQFGVYNDPRGGLTSMSVDDVEVWVCEQ